MNGYLGVPVVDSHGKLVRRKAAEQRRVHCPMRAQASMALKRFGTIGNIDDHWYDTSCQYGPPCPTPFAW